MAARAKFTRIPKTTELLAAGVPTEAIPTYCALADHANNKTGLCWPKMETLATILNRSVRTVQRHLYQLKEARLIEFVSRRRYKGRFSSYTYKILHIATTGHTHLVEKRRPIYKGTKQLRTTPKSPIKQGYEWLFGEESPSDTQETQETTATTKRRKEAKRRTDGYEWLFS